MARSNFGSVTQKSSVKRKGVHSKSASSHPQSKKYKKKYRGQGRP